MPIRQQITDRRVPVKIWTADVEASARRQLENIASLPIVHGHVAAMPDVHAGIGATVGSVIPTKSAIVPAAVGVDIGCFAGDTEVILADNHEYKIADLARRTDAFFVYSCTPEGRIFGAAATATRTRADAALVEVELDNGARIRCTPDHRFMMRDGQYREAAQLRRLDSLMPFYSDLDKEGYVRVLQPGSGKYQRAHWIMARSGLLGESELIKRSIGLYMHRRSRHGVLANHKVVAVRPLQQREDVYCLSVPKFHNFALAAGVFVHNCGMNAVQLSLTAKDLPESLGKMRSAIERAVPVGFDLHDDVEGGREDAARKLKKGLDRIVARTPAIATMHKNFGKTWMRQIGTLGGGNHFIEVCLDESQNVWVMLHSGSRGIGNAIGRHFIGEARREMEKSDVHLPDRDLAWLSEGTSSFDRYVEAVHWAQDYAMENRRAMMHAILAAMAPQLPPFRVIGEALNCHHNYVARERHFGEELLVTRKGAIRAGEGEMGIIPGSMGARSFIVRGKGNPDSLCSCAHGAGRLMSRAEAKRRFSQADVVRQTDGVECRKDSGVIDEIPSAYKPIDEVMANQSDLVEVVHTLKQVLCVKG